MCLRTLGDKAEPRTLSSGQVGSKGRFWDAPERRSRGGGGERVKGRLALRPPCGFQGSEEVVRWPWGPQRGRGGPGLALQLPWLPLRSPVGEGCC